MVISADTASITASTSGVAALFCNTMTGLSAGWRPLLSRRSTAPFGITLLAVNSTPTSIRPDFERVARLRSTGVELQDLPELQAVEQL